MEKTFTTTINGKEYSIKTGKIAKQASGSVIVQCGETIVLVTAVGSKDPKPEISFLPLTVEYQEKIYSAATIRSCILGFTTFPSSSKLPLKALLKISGLFNG